MTRPIAELIEKHRSKFIELEEESTNHHMTVAALKKFIEAGFQKLELVEHSMVITSAQDYRGHTMVEVECNCCTAPYGIHVGGNLESLIALFKAAQPVNEKTVEKEPDGD